MALVWADGFDHWGSAANARNCYTSFVDQGGTTFNTSVARTGACRFFGSNNGNIVRAINSPPTELIAGAAFRATGIGTSFGATTGFLAMGGISVFMNNLYGFTTNVGGLVSAPNLWAVDTWFYLELRVKLNGANDEIEVRLNGTTIISGTGNYSASTTIDSVASGRSSGAAQYYMDDFYICDKSGANNNDFLGDRRMRTIFPASDSAPQDWTEASGTDAWAMLDNVPANNAQYVQATAAGQVSKFGMGPALPGNTSNIAALVVFQRSIKSDNGGAAVTFGIENTNGTVTGAAQNPLDTTDSYGITPDIFELDGGGFYWDYNTVNNSELVLTRTV